MFYRDSFLKNTSETYKILFAVKNFSYFFLLNYFSSYVQTSFEVNETLHRKILVLYMKTSDKPLHECRNHLVTFESFFKVKIFPLPNFYGDILVLRNSRRNRKNSYY